MGGLFEVIGQILADIGDDQLLKVRRKILGAAQDDGGLAARRRGSSGEKARHQSLELLGFGMGWLATPRIGVARGDEQGVGAVDTAGFHKELERFVGLKTNHRGDPVPLRANQLN